jgi:hypothetical protein
MLSAVGAVQIDPISATFLGAVQRFVGGGNHLINFVVPGAGFGYADAHRDRDFATASGWQLARSLLRGLPAIVGTARHLTAIQLPAHFEGRRCNGLTQRFQMFKSVF